MPGAVFPMELEWQLMSHIFENGGTMNLKFWIKEASDLVLWDSMHGRAKRPRLSYTCLYYWRNWGHIKRNCEPWCWTGTAMKREIWRRSNCSSDTDILCLSIANKPDSFRNNNNIAILHNSVKRKSSVTWKRKLIFHDKLYLITLQDIFMAA